MNHIFDAGASKTRVIKTPLDSHDHTLAQAAGRRATHDRLLMKFETHPVTEGVKEVFGLSTSAGFVALTGEEILDNPFSPSSDRPFRVFTALGEKAIS